MDLDEIAEVQYRESKKERSHHKSHKKEHRKKHSKEERRSKEKSKKEKSEKSQTKRYDLKISESALRSILSQAGIDTENYKLCLVAEKKSAHNK